MTDTDTLASVREIIAPLAGTAADRSEYGRGRAELATLLMSVIEGASMAAQSQAVSDAHDAAIADEADRQAAIDAAAVAAADPTASEPEADASQLPDISAPGS